MPQLRFTAPAALLLAVLGLSQWPATAADPETLDGQLTVIWIDARSGEDAPGDNEYWLHTRQGRVQLDVPDKLRGAIHRLDRKPVRVRGRSKAPAPGRPSGPPPHPVFEVRDVQAAPAGEGGAAAVVAEPYAGSLGKKPWANLLCAFPDSTGEQRELSYFDAMFASTRPGLDYYWKELSHGQFTIAGSKSVGWYTLPRPQSSYMNSDGFPNLQLMLDDCAAVADADVYFPDYAGVNLVFNGSFGCCAWGGAGVINHDGVSRIYGMTWMPEWGWRNHTVFGHEMGHGLGLPHSRGNNQTYRNLWDVMSDLWYSCHLANDPVLGCLGQHTIAYHKDRLGWIPSAARYTLAPGETASLQLDKLERPNAGTHQMAVIPIHGSTGHYYTVEARRKYGFDVRLPGASVVIHEVNTSHGEPANVVDGDDNGDPYDAGTRWLVGETFTDARNGISVAVDATDGAGFLVTLTSTETPIFADGFESGDTSEWSGGKFDSGDFAVTTAAAMEGAYGASVTIDDNNQVHITDHTPVGVRNYLARFRFNPNRIRMVAGDRFTIFGAYTGGAYAAMVELRHASAGYELRALTRLDDGTQLITPAIYIIEEHPFEVQLEWQAASADGASDGALRFLVNGTPVADYTGLDNDTLRVERSLMGAVTGVDTGTRGTMYFDGFESRQW